MILIFVLHFILILIDKDNYKIGGGTKISRQGSG